MLGQLLLLRQFGDFSGEEIGRVQFNRGQLLVTVNLAEQLLILLSGGCLDAILQSFGLVFEYFHSEI